ncbi:hypothetical protein RRG08_040872 [Elysia crispata]|uniref:Uncharacterized protein n=1 Tax=Elysia crispata TaxID=231223 RepID=A0AAE1E8I8_9GAST|nr:hypothetical protein RRG08_040872 [Elysia crispata]
MDFTDNLLTWCIQTRHLSVIVCLQRTASSLQAPCCGTLFSEHDARICHRNITKCEDIYCTSPVTFRELSRIRWFHLHRHQENESLLSTRRVRNDAILRRWTLSLAGARYASAISMTQGR